MLLFSEMKTEALLDSNQGHQYSRRAIKWPEAVIRGIVPPTFERRTFV